MRKIRKRVFAAMLAAALLFTMPGMVSYAEAEGAQTKDISESVTIEQAEDDAAEETGAETEAEAMQESDAEDSDTDKPGTGEDDTGDTETDAQEPAEEIVPPAQKEDAKECTCGTLCTQDSINGDCPVCGAEDADLSRCKGEKTENSSEENKEDAGQEDTGEQDDSANLCAHHKEHTKDCGYSPASEDGEGSQRLGLCTYDCRICPIEDMIAALPDEVTEDNAEKVREQLNKILSLYRELTAEEQEQIDLTRCYDLQAELDEANVLVVADGHAEKQTGDEASVDIGGSITYYSTLAAAFSAANGKTATITMLTDAECTSSDYNNPSPLVVSGGTVTLDMNGQTLSGSGYGYEGAIIGVSGGSLTIQGGGIVKVQYVGIICTGGILTVADTTFNLFGPGYGSADCAIQNGGPSKGGTVIINGGTITGKASNGQIFHYFGNTTINNVTATGTTDSNIYSVKYDYKGTLKINGGTFDSIALSDEATGISDVAGLLGDNVIYKHQGGTWATDDEMAGRSIENVTVQKIPLTINPQADTSWYYNSGAHSLKMNAVPVTEGATITYEWYDGSTKLDCTADAYPVPETMAVGNYTYTCNATCDGYTLSHDFTFTVSECPHTGLVYEQQANNKHGGTCPDCGEVVSEEHTWVDGTCEDCNLKAAVKVEIGNATTYYGGIGPAWTAATAEGVTSAEITLLDNVTEATLLSMSTSRKITLNGGNYTLSVNIIQVSGGQLDISNGTFKFGGALMVSGGTVRLSGGKFINTNGLEAIFCVPDSNLTVGDFLLNYGDASAETHYAYYQGNEPVDLTKLEKQNVLTGTVTVGECEHTDVTPTPNNDGTHTLKCPYCGYTEAAEGCSYGTEYQHDDTNHWQTCTVCGYEKTEAHYWELDSEQSGNVFENYQLCLTCLRTRNHFTLTITIPNGLTYGNTEGKQVTYTVSPEITCDQVTWRFTDGNLPEFTDGVLPAGLPAGKHWFRVNGDMSDGTHVFSNSTYITVNPAPLTGNMVTLSPESVTYSGAEQKPTITVKQGNTTLKEGTDYDVAYSPADLTNAGTVTVTITGKGNYTGEVKTAYTIERATPDIGTVTAEEMNDTLDVSRVVLSRTNQTPAGILTLTDSALRYGTHTYKWQFTPDDAVNYKPVTGTVQITVNDTIAPTAEYQIGTDGWKKFINTVSFGLFCKDYRTVAIRGTDDTDTVTGSGIALTQYYISDQEMTDTDNIAWNTYTGPVSLNAQGTYFVYVKVTDNAGNTAVLNSEGIVIYAESTVSPAAFDYTYRQNQDCTVQLTMNGNTFKELTDNAGNAISTENYTIDGNGKITLKAAYLDMLGKGGYAYKVSMNPQGIETDQVPMELIPLVYTFTVNVKAKELTVTGAAATGRAYNGTNTVEITAVTISGAVPGDDVAVDLSGVQGTLSCANAGTYSSVTLPELTLTGADKGNYTLVQPTGAVAASVTVTPLDAAITVGTDTYNKTFGDAAFTLDVTDNNTEADVQYEVTAGADVISVSNGTVTIQNAGTAAITVSLPASTNYNAAASKTITVTVAKKGGYTVAEMNRSYLYSRGNTDSIDLAALLPKDCGNVTYGTPAASGDVTYSVVPAVNDGKLSYTLNSGEINAEGTITVTVETRNYTDITITVKVKLTDQIPVSLKTGTEVTLENNVLTYGEPLSKLVFNEAEFVGDDGKTVEGTLAWKDAAATPDAGTASATWVFIPTDKAYASVEGTAAITVNKAVPAVSAAPTVAGRVYDPSITLKDDKLSGATVTGVGGNTLEGTWSWQSANIVPTVNNSGYVAVFTPKDTTNYETVTRTITVTVTKATPYIAELPAAAGITYGDTLDVSALSGGTVVYGNGAGQEGDKAGSTETVAGAFTWKEPSTKPVAADSNVTEFAVVFTPSDTANYNPVEAKVRLTVNKAQNAPNMLGSTMSVSNSIEKVGSVPLPAGWEWQVKDTALEAGVAVSAVAVYTGADKGNYENETVTVAITREVCRHENTELRNEVTATCQKKGYSGDTYCLDCGEMLEKGTETNPTDHSGGTATCTSGKVCEVCGTEYTEKNSANHTHTEIRGAAEATCTADGYTGDTYCTDCNTITGTGTVIPATAHTEDGGSVTKEPTETEKGVRTYKCSVCGYVMRTEEIEKLPSNPGSGDDNSGSGSGTDTPSQGTKQPFIKGEDGKIGWDVIRAEEEQAQEGGIINVDMNGSAVVPGDIFDSIKGRNITITFDIGGGIIWSVDGKSVTADRTGDIDFDLKTGVNSIPVDIVNNVTGERYSIQISLAHEGEFGFTAVLSINLGKENAGYTASLYYYNQSTGELEFICADEVAVDGTASLAFTHASDYVIAIDGDEEESGITEPAQPDGTEGTDGDSTAAVESPKTGQRHIAAYIIALIAVAIAGIAVFVRWKKEEKEGDG